MLVKVLQHHIDEGRRRSAHRCPIALALKEQTGEDWGVCGSHIRRGGSHSLCARGLWDFVTRFDSGRPVEPIELDFR